MRRNALIDAVIRAGKAVLESTRKPSKKRTHQSSDRPSKRRDEPVRPSSPPPARDIDSDRIVVSYEPCMDGDPDPGEVVWTWVPYEDDPSQGKDRPVIIIGRRSTRLLGVALTSKQKDNEEQVPVGTGPWDREGRPSYAKVERLLEVDPDQVRREGAILPRNAFDDVVEGVRRSARG